MSDHMPFGFLGALHGVTGGRPFADGGGIQGVRDQPVLLRVNESGRPGLGNKLQRNKTHTPAKRSRLMFPVILPDRLDTLDSGLKTDSAPFGVQCVPRR